MTDGSGPGRAPCDPGWRLLFRREYVWGADTPTPGDRSARIGMLIAAQLGAKAAKGERKWG
ncbi:hypothetical protein [Streptomyces sp. SID5643]|uniref:hypothetical protein n=1 Tax=Streptomyces sp. SID5643 TaxID=2690307 RepID=UPI001370BD7F|nr:hypothetical protein [Streptomyces sp. SID5643]MZF88845.1 hypothetical protein [Streptomyces sp. SID5643]